VSDIVNYELWASINKKEWYLMMEGKTKPLRITSINLIRDHKLLYPHLPFLKIINLKTKEEIINEIQTN